MLVWPQGLGYRWHNYIDTYPIECVSNVVLDVTMFVAVYKAGRAVRQTQVYRLRKLLGIGWTHATGLMQIWQDYRRPAIKRLRVGMEEF